MKKCKKVMALVLALIMLLSASCVSLMASAATIDNSASYDKNALKGYLNAADQYDLTYTQYTSMMLDFADKFLSTAGLPSQVLAVSAGPLDINITINLKDLNGIHETIYQFPTLLKSFSSLSSFLGDIPSLDFSAFSTSNKRVKGTYANDVAYVNAFVSFLSTNRSAVSTIIKSGLGSNGFDLGALNSFVPDNIKDITNDIVGFLKKTLFGDSNASLDTNVAQLLTDTINGLDIEMLDGYKFEKTDSIYLTIDKLVRVLTKWLVKNLQADTWGFKDMVLSAIPTFETDYPFVDLDAITQINWDWEADGMGTKFVSGTPSTYIVYHINNMLGTVVETLIPEFKTFKGSLKDISNTAGWKYDNSTSSLTTLNNNIAKAAQYADIKLTGGTFTEAEANALTNPTKSYAMVLADAVIKMFLPGLKVEKDDIVAGNICVLAVQAINEFFCYYLPEYALSDLYTYDASGATLNRTKYTESYCSTLYKQMGARVIAKFASGYFPVTFSNETNIDAVLKDLASYFMNTVAKAGSLSKGALGTISSTETVYTAVDRIIFSLDASGNYKEGASSSGGRNTTGILPQGFLPAKYNTSYKLVYNWLLASIEGLDVGKLFEIFVPNTSNTDMNTAILPNVLCYEAIRIINVIFPGTWTSKTGSLDSLITNNNLATIVGSILANLGTDSSKGYDGMNYIVFPALKLVANVLGLASSQNKGEAVATLANPITTDAGTVYKEIEPVIRAQQVGSVTNAFSSDYYIKVTNTSNGISSGYHNKNGSEVIDTPYKVKVFSITCVNDANVTVSGVSDTGTIIKTNDSQGFKISYGDGVSARNKTLIFKVSYVMSDEGENWPTTGENQQAYLFAYYGAPTTATKSSGAISAIIPTTIYGTPSMLSNVIGYSYSSNTKYTATCEDTTFPSALENAGFVFSASDIGAPDSSTPTQYTMFSVSAPSSVDVSKYYGSYSINYTFKSKDSSNSDAEYGNAVSQTITMVLFDDAGLEKLVSKYEGLVLQSYDYSNPSLWDAFNTQLSSAKALVKNPASVGSNAPATLTAAFKAKAEALTTAYENLKEVVATDYTATLKNRLIEYADGDAKNDIRAKYTMWDYTPVSYARYSSTVSTIRNYLRTEDDLSSVAINEALRYNDVMAKRLCPTSSSSETAALNNLKAVRNNFDKANYDPTKYTPASYEALVEAFDDADQVIAGTGLDGESTPKVSDYADARAAILSSLNKLIVQPFNVDELYAVVQNAEENYFDNVTYTDEAWAVYEAAMEQANVAINDPYSLLPEEYTASDISAVEATFSDYIANINSAIQNLLDNPYVSILVSAKDGAVAYDSSEKIIVGSRVIEAGDAFDSYIIVPYGATGNNISDCFTFSENVSRYTKDEDGNWNTYSTGTGATFACYADENLTGRQITSASLKSGNAVKVTDSNGSETVYKIVVTGNAGGTTVSKTNLQKEYGERNAAINGIYAVLPNIIANNLDSSTSDADILACDLNCDGMIDNTDLVLLKMWKNGTFIPFNNFNITV